MTKQNQSLSVSEDNFIGRLNLSTFTNIGKVDEVISKAEEDEAEEVELSTADEIQKAVDEGEYDTLTKALSSLKYSSTIKFYKTGKDIKARLLIIMNQIAERVLAWKENLVTLEEAIGEAPTEKLDSWELESCPAGSCDSMKKYNYNKTYYNEGSKQINSYGNTEVSSGNSVQGATSKDIAKNCSEYNDTVRKIVNGIKDLAVANAFKNNVEDKKKYELSIDQITELGF